MYVTVEELEHGLTRQYGVPSTRRTAKALYEYAKADWTKRGYTILERLYGKAVIVDGDEEARAVGVIQIIQVQ